MAREKPGVNTYTWRDRYLTLFQVLWDKPHPENRREQQDGLVNT